MYTGNIVNIKAAAYYITFNLKTGFNWEIDGKGVDEDYTNQVLVHEGLDIPFRQTLKNSYFDTILVGNLANVGDTVEISLPQGYLIVRLCSIDTTGANGAIVSIGLDNVGCALPPGEVSNPVGIQTLQNHVPVTGISGFRNDMFEFRMDFTDSSDPVTCTTYGGAGDVDLFLNWGSTPQVTFVEGLNAVRKIVASLSRQFGTDTVNPHIQLCGVPQCSSGNPWNDESCTVSSEASGVLFVTLHAYTSITGVTIECKAGEESFSTSQDQPTSSPIVAVEDTQELEDGIGRIISAEIDERLRFKFPVDSFHETVICSIGGGVGDADLYVSKYLVDFDSPGEEDVSHHVSVTGTPPQQRSTHSVLVV